MGNIFNTAAIFIGEDIKNLNKKIKKNYNKKAKILSKRLIDADKLFVSLDLKDIKLLEKIAKDFGMRYIYITESIADEVFINTDLSRQYFPQSYYIDITEVDVEDIPDDLEDAFGHIDEWGPYFDNLDAFDEYFDLEKENKLEQLNDIFNPHDIYFYSYEYEEEATYASGS